MEELVLVSKIFYEPSQLPYLGNCVGLRCVVDPRSPVGDIIDTWVSGEGLAIRTYFRPTQGYWPF